MPHPPIRVLRVIGRLAVGGPSLHATLLTDRLDRARFHTTLVTGAHEPGEADYLELHQRQLPVERVPHLGREVRLMSDASAIRHVVRLIRRIQPQIVHTHTAKAGAVGRIAAILCRVPIIVHTYHGHVLRQYFSPAKTALYRSLESALARGTDRLLAVSDKVRSELVELGVGTSTQYHTLPLGIDLAPLLVAERRRGELRAELSCGDAPLIGIVARLVPIKAHEVFLAAAARIRRDVPNACFLIVGDGESRPGIERTAGELGLRDAVRFLGWRADIDRLYADLDVVVLTSRNEGSPVALIEAMAAGTPVVSTNVGGVSDVIKHEVTGLLAPMDDAVTVAAHVTALLRDPARARSLAVRGRASVAKTYSAERLVRDIEDLYTALVAEKGLAG